MSEGSPARVRTINDVYNSFGPLIIPNLRQHQFNVAAIGTVLWQSIFPETQLQIAQELFENQPHANLGTSLTTEAGQCISWMLLIHDIGNWAKMNPTLYPQLYEPVGGVATWQQAKNEALIKYAQPITVDDSALPLEVLATQNMSRELGCPLNWIQLVKHIGFGHAARIITEDSLLLKLITYPDLLVDIDGIKSLEGRARASRRRYLANHNLPLDLPPDTAFFNLLELNLQIEKALFQHSSLTPEALVTIDYSSTIEDLGKMPFPCA